MADWKRSDFDSFWRHHNIAQIWPSSSDFGRMKRKATDYYYINHYDKVTPSEDDIRSISGTIDRIRIKTTKLLEGSDSTQEEETETEEEMIPDEGGHIFGNEEDWTPEMKEYVRTTQQHRQELAEARARATEAKKDNWLDKDTDEFVLIEEIGVHGVQKPTTSGPTHNKEAIAQRAHLVEMYGEDADRIGQMEFQMYFRFEKVYNEKNAKFWPNMPLRL